MRAAAIEEARGTNLYAGEAVWLGFLEAFRTFWLAPLVELRVLMKEIRISKHAVGQLDQRARSWS